MIQSLFFLYLLVVFIHTCLGLLNTTQCSDDLGDRKWLRTDFGVVWYTSTITQIKKIQTVYSTVQLPYSTVL